MTESPKSLLRLSIDLAILATPLLVAIVVSAIMLGTRPGVLSSPATSLGTIDILTPGFVSVLAVSLLLYGLRRNADRIARLVKGAIIVAGTISGLATLNFPISATLLGSLIGGLFPPVFTILLLFALSIFDVLLVENNALTKIVGAQNYQDVVKITTLPLHYHLVGIGDLLVFSMLVACSARLSGLYSAGATLVLILAGAFITLELVRTRFRFAGLAIPIWLGLIPSILGFLLM